MIKGIERVVPPIQFDLRGVEVTLVSDTIVSDTALAVAENSGLPPFPGLVSGTFVSDTDTTPEACVVQAVVPPSPT